MSDVTTTPEQELHLALRVLRDTLAHQAAYDYIREAYEEQALATRCSWDELGKQLQEAINRIGNVVADE